MDSRRYHNALSLLDLFSPINALWCKACDYKHVNVVSSQSLAKNFSSEPEALPRICLKTLKVALKIRIGIRVAVCEEDIVILMKELD